MTDKIKILTRRTGEQQDIILRMTNYKLIKK